MLTEFKKRILTSIFMFIIVIIIIWINKIIFMIGSLVITMICFNEWNLMNSKYYLKNKFKFFLIMASGFVYLFVFFLVSAWTLRGDTFESVLFFIIILCICFSSDIGGYVFGKTIGGKKLTKISPNKTISGSLGSFIFSLLPLFLFNFKNYADVFFDISVINILFCLIVSFMCQLGDLFVSYFKRLNNIKDTGNLLPGHGGLLDRIDGIIFAIPTVYILIILQIF